MELKTTRGQIQDFLRSALWEDINSEVDGWVEGFQRERDSLLDYTTPMDSSQRFLLAGELKGREMAIQYLKRLPEVFLEYIEQQEALKEKEKEDGTG